MLNTCKKILVCIAGCILCSAALNWVAIPNGFPAIAIAGLAQTAEHFTGINYTNINYILTILILLLTFLTLGKGEVTSILFMSVLYATTLWVMNRIPVRIVLEEKLLSAALYGVLTGVGTGIVLRIGYSYGGMDTLSKILKKKLLKSWETGRILLLITFLVTVVMLTAYSLDAIAYAFVGQLAMIWSMNYVLFNMGPRLYQVEIIADSSEGIREFVIEQLQKSLTSLSVKGAYSGETKIQMDCVCTSKEYLKLREYLLEHDIQCFLKVMPLMHVFGTNKDFEKLADESL